MKKILKAALAALICLLMCIPAQADIGASRMEDDGLIRVYLKSLNDPENLSLRLMGAYTVEHDAGFRFDSGTELVLSCVEDSIYLCVGGLTLDMGAAVTLTRQASDSEEKGMYIAESEKNNLYKGDLNVTIGDGGGLFPVLEIGMEDYLCGVVAYEMSDSWPVEALKAQAVAARTYAIQRKWMSGDRSYDVVDTAGDQVYKGFDPEYGNVIRAVEETSGVVGTWRGGFASCYFTASNGGETALPDDIWGSGGDYGYLDRREDPYDLENRNSMVKSMTIGVDGSGNEGLRAMLDEGLLAAAQAQGVSVIGLKLEQIISIEPVEPLVEGSHMYTKLRFTIGASALESRFQPGEDDIGALRGETDSAATNITLFGMDYLRRIFAQKPYEQVTAREMLDTPLVVDILAYEQLKDELDMGMNSRDCEIFSVRRDESQNFVIEARRFGHGVGMSQRGAQTMAGSYGMTYEEILAFYYPGMTLERMAWSAPELEEMEALPESVGRARPAPTPEPTPAPLPALKEGEYYASVTLESSSTLNLRSEPSTNAFVVAMLGNGRRVIVTGAMDDDGWVPVKTAEYEGYVKLEYLTKE